MPLLPSELNIHLSFEEEEEEEVRIYRYNRYDSPLLKRKKNGEGGR